MRVERLACCCCGNETRGRQWFNRDTGYGLCSDCVSYCQADVPVGKTHQSYGIRGYHYDLDSVGDK